MKRNTSILMTICLICVVFFTFNLSVNANDTLQVSTGGTLSKVTYRRANNAEEIRVFSTSTKIVNQYLIAPEGSAKNYRLCIEIEDASIARTIRFDINKGSVVQIRLANMSNPRRTNLVIETTSKPIYNITTASDGKSFVLTLGKQGTSAPTPSPSPTPTPSPSPNPSPTPIPSPSPNPNPSPSPTPISPNPNQSNQGKNTVSNGPLSWGMSGDSCILTLNNINLKNLRTGSEPRFEHRENEKIIQFTLPGKDTRFKEGYFPGNSVIYGVLVNYNIKNNCTIIRISYADTIIYSQAVSDGSSVFIIDSKSKTIPTDSPKPPSESQKPTPTPSPKPTPTPSPKPTPTPSPGSTNQNGDATKVPSNIKQGNSDSANILRLTGQSIISKYHSHKEKIIVDEAKDNSSITFMIPINIVNLGNGSLNLNNSVASSAAVLTTQNYSFLTVTKKDPSVQFEITLGSGTDELIIRQSTKESTLPDTPSVGSKLVVLDPGHGGNDPGAVFGANNQYLEKTYNLDIALRCQAILKSKGINVAMTRTTDKYVSLEDRTKFANDINATHFVSIHNNSMPKGYKGSMTLYYASSYKGKDYARIVQRNLVNDLNTNDIGLKGNNLYVLKYTKMPAVLAEIVCMSDKNDLLLLQNDAFIQKSAESLAKSIIEILSLD